MSADDAAAPQRVPLAAIADVRLGKMLDKAKHRTGRRLPYLRNVNVRWGRVDTDDLLEMHFEEDELDRFGLREGDVLVCEGGEPGRAAVWDGSIPGLKYQKALHRVRFRVPYDPRLLMYQLELLARTGGLERQFTGSTIKHFTGEAFKRLPVPLLPLETQNAIVAEIETQFSRLDAAITALKRAQANLKRCRASVLKAACEGRLVPTEAELARREGRSYETGAELLARVAEERRRGWEGRYGEPAVPDAARLAELPEGWASATIDELTDPKRRCAYGVLQPGPHDPMGVPLVRVGDIANGRVDVSSLKRVSPAIAAQFPRTRLQGGELAITLVGAIGRTAVVPPSLAGANTARAVGIVPLGGLVQASWLAAWFQSPDQIHELDGKAHEVARKTLNLEDVRRAVVALPPAAEQDRIVGEVERRLSALEAAEKAVGAGLQRAARLRQAVLARAFSV